MNSKSIIIMIPAEFDFSDIFEKNFKNVGFSVYNLTTLLKFNYSGLSQKILKFIHYSILKNKNYKKQIIRNNQLKKLKELEAIFSQKKADFCLAIRPDLWDYDVVKNTTLYANYSVCYQWDGFSRYPSIHKYIPLFDSFFAFDAKDVSNSIRLSTNFYFDIPNMQKKKIKNEVVYIGTYNEERLTLLNKIIKHLKENKIGFKIILFFDNKHDIDHVEPTDDIEYISQRFSYENTLRFIDQYSTILDLQNSYHSGLSFRHFEAIKMGKKVITNNQDVIKYDFYTPSNTFVLNEKNMQDLTHFLNTSFEPFKNEICYKYSFSNWYKYILNMEPFVSLDAQKN